VWTRPTAPSDNTAESAQHANCRSLGSQNGYLRLWLSTLDDTAKTKSRPHH
jgi:hypothetical protein